MAGQRVHSHNSYFFVRVFQLTFEISGREEHERKSIVGHRWWSVGELASTKEVILPRGLDRLMPPLLAGRLPAQPVPLPWVAEPGA